MRKVIFLLTAITLFSVSAVYSQCCPYIDTVIVDPATPDTNDEIRIITQVTTPNLGAFLGHSYTIQGNTISVAGCYYSGMLTALQTFTDTLVIGNLPAGTYTVEFTASLSEQEHECVLTPASPSQQTSVDFVVSDGTAGIGDQETMPIELFPNPVMTEFTIRGENLEQIRIFSADGKQAMPAMNVQEEQLTLDLSGLSKGTYFLETIGRDGQIFRSRFVKQ